ncbi:MAG: hypothetical protein LRZ88_06255 [Candidatus Cloacimonetes bacterium]|nr:hypothetical protein [Candidatus Cloacimonadota bacterium]
MSDELVLTKAKEIPGFPDDLLLNLRHLILSHHGEYEKGFRAFAANLGSYRAAPL